MCKAIEDMLADARNEAIDEGRLNIIDMLRELNFSKDVAVQQLSKRIICLRKRRRPLWTTTGELF